VARLRARIARAAALHRQAEAVASAAGRLLHGYAPVSAAAEQHAEQHALAARLRAAAARLAPGWLDAPLDALSATTPLGGSTLPTFVRVGQAHPLDDAGFPVMVPLLRAGHVAIDADARDPRVAGLLRTLVLRLLAAAPRGSVEVRIVDSAEVGATFEAFRPAPFPPAATDQTELRTLLTEAERWVANRPETPTAPTLLLVIASLPELTDGSDLARISALAKAGPSGRLHIIAAGWPPPPLTAETTQRPLPYGTQIALRNPHALVGDPPGATFAGSGTGPGRLNAPVYLDADPPHDLIGRVCAELTAGHDAGRASQTTAPPAPDPTAWREYITAAQRLDAVHRRATAVVADHGALRAGALGELGTVRTRLAAQTVRFADAVAAAGLQDIPLVPTKQMVDAELTAVAGVGAPLTAVTAALRGANAFCDAADQAMVGDPTDPDGAPAAWRNIAVYGAFAVLASLAQVPLLLLVDDVRASLLMLVPSALLLPPVAFGLAWTFIGALDGGGDANRTPLAGAVVTAIGATPLLAFAAFLVASTIAG
jgi:hypothetical protein